MTRLLRNSGRGPLPRSTAPSGEPLAYHRRLPGYQPTPLVDAPRLARRLGVGRVSVKDESARLGLPSFKILGASWATYCALRERFPERLDGWETFDELAARTRMLGPLTLAAATDGNHGRALARIAALLGLTARIYVPAGTAQAQIDAITGEGAAVTVVDGTYGDAVARSAADADDRCLVVSDTSWPGYEDTPRRVIDGYSTILCEIDDQLEARGWSPPDVVFVQIGVGALAAAVIRHVRRRDSNPLIIGVEPVDAACALASAEAGAIANVPGPHRSIMAGLNCDAPSLVAWPTLYTGIDWFLALDDTWAAEGVRALADEAIVAGETGAAGAAGALALATEPTSPQDIGLHPQAHLLVLCTEGATDPETYAASTGDCMAS
ncbi:MAG TPA: diaminopropionate ammonia-lyase [Gaiellaceae bacterium]|nr:diaminopropionate ammonia-lyase [Gaiellaceae bacterium]